jgi:hypothetical protein
MGATAAVHPNDQTLQSYGLGKLDDASAESVSKHLESCSHCQSRVAEMSSDSFLARLRNARVQPGSPVTAPVVSSLAGLSILDAGASATSPPAAETLPPGLVNIELQSSHDKELVETTWFHQAALYHRHKVPVLNVLVLLRRDANSPRFTGAFEIRMRDGWQTNQYNGSKECLACRNRRRTGPFSKKAGRKDWLKT